MPSCTLASTSSTIVPLFPSKNKEEEKTCFHVKCSRPKEHYKYGYCLQWLSIDTTMGKRHKRRNTKYDIHVIIEFRSTHPTTLMFDNEPYTFQGFFLLVHHSPLSIPLVNIYSKKKLQSLI